MSLSLKLDPLSGGEEDGSSVKRPPWALITPTKPKTKINIPAKTAMLRGKTDIRFINRLLLPK
jgi:hypothetical protein